MKIIFLDAETFYSKEYTLRKMTPVEYILDPRFELIGCAVKETHPSNNPPMWLSEPEFREYLSTLDPEDTCVVTYNALFDMSIFTWRYGFKPKLMIDMLGVARACLSHKLRSLSLAKVSEHLGIGVKGTTVHNVIGMTAADIRRAGLWDAYGEYSKLDNELCYGIYQRLVASGEFPVSELVVQDMVLRCAIEPKLQLDTAVLTEHLATIKAEKELLLTQAMLLGADGKSDLMSNDRFAELLRGVGCEPPTKVSLITGQKAYAFAKTDPGFIELEEHPNPAVQALVAARLGHKSTLEESRTERLLKIANLQWPDGSERMMPIPLRYAGAHTHRLSGDWKLNLQNLPRGSALRRALTAPGGFAVVTVDAAQIEARINAWFCGQDDLVEAFANGEDIYSNFASTVFGYPVSKDTHPTERFIGKTSILGLGYQVGASKFSTTIEVQSGLQLGKKVDMPLAEAARVVSLYRNTYHRIPAMWQLLHKQAIPVLAYGGRLEIGPVVFEKGVVTGPSGLKLYYDKLEQTQGDKGPQWEFRFGGNPKKLYGGALLENLVQHLARIHTMDAAVRIRKALGLASQVHDELVYVVPLGNVPAVKALLKQEMCRPPVWAPGLPLAADVGFGPNYGSAK